MNEMRKLIEAIEKINEVGAGPDQGLPDAEFDQFVRELTSIKSSREQLQTLYLWIKAEDGLTENDFIDLAEYVIG